MNKTIFFVYKCYLGKHLLFRTAVICEFVAKHEGIEFFNKYSLASDSILNFIKSCKKEGWL